MKYSFEFPLPCFEADGAHRSEEERERVCIDEHKKNDPNENETNSILLKAREYTVYRSLFCCPNFVISRLLNQTEMKDGIRHLLGSSNNSSDTDTSSWSSGYSVSLDSRSSSSLIKLDSKLADATNLLSSTPTIKCLDPATEQPQKKEQSDREGSNTTALLPTPVEKMNKADPPSSSKERSVEESSKDHRRVSSDRWPRGNDKNHCPEVDPVLPPLQNTDNDPYVWSLDLMLLKNSHKTKHAEQQLDHLKKEKEVILLQRQQRLLRRKARSGPTMQGERKKCRKTLSLSKKEVPVLPADTLLRHKKVRSPDKISWPITVRVQGTQEPGELSEKEQLKDDLPDGLITSSRSGSPRQTVCRSPKESRAPEIASGHDEPKESKRCETEEQSRALEPVVQEPTRDSKKASLSPKKYKGDYKDSDVTDDSNSSNESEDSDYIMDM